MAITNRKEREIIAYLPEDLVLSGKVKSYIDKKNSSNTSGVDNKYTKSQIVTDALNLFFKTKGIK